MKTNYPLKYILEYIPSRYVGLNAKQQQVRKAVWNFKDGSCSDELRKRILDSVSSSISGNGASFQVCFLPASTKEKTIRRYSTLANYLCANLECEVRLDAIINAYDTESGHLNRKNGCPTENLTFRRDIVKGKRVILIDDVITRGLTFNTAADKLMEAGAASVQGVFIAKTVHPDLPIENNTPTYHGESEWMYEDDLLDTELMNEIAQEEMDDAIYRNEILQDMMAEGVWEEATGCKVYDTQTFLEVSGLTWSDIM